MEQKETTSQMVEHVVVLAHDSCLCDELVRILPHIRILRLDNLPDTPRELETQFGLLPSLIVVDATWEDSPAAWEEVMTWPLQRELNLQEEDFLALPPCLRAVARLSGFRLKGGWRNCLVFLVFPQNKPASCIQLGSRLGADWVFRQEIGWSGEFISVLSRLREVRPLSELTVKLKVLVAENTVDVFVLLDTLLEGFCHLEMSLDDHSQSLRDSRNLAAGSVVRDFKAGAYDAVVVDMALSIRQENSALTQLKAREGRGLLAEKRNDELLGIVKDNMEGLVAVKRLREMNDSVPICVFSNYIGHPDFRSVMHRFWGSRVYDSIAIFPKIPDGRVGLQEWLARHRGSPLHPGTSRICGGIHDC